MAYHGQYDLEHRKAARRQAKLRKQRARLLVCIFFLVLILLALLVLVEIVRRESKVVREEVTLEAGAGITLEMFLQKPAEDAAFVTDISSIDTTRLGSYDIEISLSNKTYSTRLTVQDTVAPAAQAVRVTTRQDALPDASAFVTNIRDVTPVSVSYQTEPDVHTSGEVTVVVLLTDAGGNTATVESTMEVISDTVPPVIEGVKDMEVYIGDSISYKANVTVTDDMDENPILEIDNSQVNLNQAGSYQVIYRATDSSGNVATETMTLTLVEKPAGYVEPEVVYEMAEKILADITDDSMDDMQVAYSIYRWVKYNIAYTGSSDKSSWTRGAYDAFTNRAGDCFNYFAAAKALLDVAGIENTDIVKSDTSHSSHYWNLINLGFGWYHFDCTPRVGSGDNFFMLTDEELDAYSRANKNSHIFDPSLYPERATESVQDQVDYSSSKLIR